MGPTDSRTLGAHDVANEIPVGLRWGTTMIKPNLFIVGFGRSGSTSLYKYLKQHPDIYMSTSKEPKFFCAEMVQGAQTSSVDTLSEYLELFAGATGEKVLGEASTMYVLSEEAAGRIHDFNPDAKIVLLLRNPVGFLQSWHSLGVRDGYESEPDLMAALDLEDERTAAGGAENRGAAVSYRYRHVIHNAPQSVQRWYDVFGPDQVKVIVFDDLSDRTEETYRDLLEFLEVDTDSVPDFEVHNSAKAFGTPKAKWVAGLMHNPKVARTVRRVLPERALGVRSGLQKLLTNRVERQALAPDDRAALVEEFTPVVKELEKIVDRDLSDWYRT